jgi:holliday junction DNA helicase RuvA
MIAYIEGRIDSVEPTFVVVDINGLGYEIRISLNTYTDIKGLEKCRLHTWLHVKEDAHTLYGFSKPAEKFLFLQLISVSGVGPGTGLMVTSSLTADEIKTAIVSEDVITIQSVKGIGAKTAQRIILELKDKLKKEGLISNIDSEKGGNLRTLRNEALTALTTLGINKAQAEKSLDLILKNATNHITLEELIKLALKRA